MAKILNPTSLNVELDDPQYVLSVDAIDGEISLECPRAEMDIVFSYAEWDAIVEAVEMVRGK